MPDCSFSECPKGSSFCEEIKDLETSKFDIGSCMGDLYLYIKAKEKTAIGVSTQYKNGEKCDSIGENLYTKCGSMTYSECDKCGDECRLANCTRNKRYDSEEKVLAHLCLPESIDMYELDDRCKAYKDVDIGIWKEKCDDSLLPSSVGFGTIIILVIIMISFFGFVLVVAWYNFQLKKTGQPPIQCPAFCPDILFPSPKPMAEQSFYSPPEISLRSFK